MDSEDDSLLSSPVPNTFVLSFYKESPLVMYREGEDAHLKKRRQSVLHLFTEEDLKEFEQYSAERPMQKQYSDRIFLLKKLNREKKLLQNEIQQKFQPLFETRREVEGIDSRKVRLELMQHFLQQFRENIQQKKKTNMRLQARIKKFHSRKDPMEIKLKEIMRFIEGYQVNRQKKLGDLAQQEQNLQKIRRRYLNELITYIIPIQRIRADEDLLRAQRQALRYAQQSFFDGVNTEEVDNDESPTTPEDRYQIVNSHVPLRGGYRVENLIAIYNGAVTREKSVGTITDFGSRELSSSNDAYETLATLSHCCHLINMIAYILSVKLPFHLHQWEFSAKELTANDLRADIAKLNANIYGTCLSQGISIELANVSYTFENLLKLLNLDQYRTRPIPVSLSQDYINILERDIVDINRALTNNYWFDDKENNVANVWEEHDYEIISTTEHIPDDMSVSKRFNNSSQTISTRQQSSVMSESVDIAKQKRSGSSNSVLSNSK